MTGKEKCKTVAKTLGVLIIVTSAVLACIAVMWPSYVSSLFKKASLSGGEKLYAEDAYKRNPTFKNLVAVSEASIRAEDNEYIVKYVGELLDSEDLPDYIASLDGGEEYYDLLATRYILSLDEVREIKFSDIVDKALGLSFGENACGASGDGAIEALIYDSYDEKNLDEILAIKSGMSDYVKSRDFTEARKTQFDADVALVERIIDVLQKAN